MSTSPLSYKKSDSAIRSASRVKLDEFAGTLGFVTAGRKDLTNKVIAEQIIAARSMQPSVSSSIAPTSQLAAGASVGPNSSSSSAHRNPFATPKAHRTSQAHALLTPPNNTVFSPPAPNMSALLASGHAVEHPRWKNRFLDGANATAAISELSVVLNLLAQSGAAAEISLPNDSASQNLLGRLSMITQVNSPSASSIPSTLWRIRLHDASMHTDAWLGSLSLEDQTRFWILQLHLFLISKFAPEYDHEYDLFNPVAAASLRQVSPRTLFMELTSIYQPVTAYPLSGCWREPIERLQEKNYNRIMSYVQPATHFVMNSTHAYVHAHADSDVLPSKLHQPPKARHDPTRCEFFHSDVHGGDGATNLFGFPGNHSLCTRPSHLCWGNQIQNSRDVSLRTYLDRHAGMILQHVQSVNPATQGSWNPSNVPINIQIRLAVDRVAQDWLNQYMQTAENTRAHSRSVSNANSPLRSLSPPTSAHHRPSASAPVTSASSIQPIPLLSPLSEHVPTATTIHPGHVVLEMSGTVASPISPSSSPSTTDLSAAFRELSLEVQRLRELVEATPPQKSGFVCCVIC